MTRPTCEQLARDALKSFDYQRYGVCTCCGRSRDDDGRPLYIAGRVASVLRCAACIDLYGAPGRRPA